MRYYCFNHSLSIVAEDHHEQTAEEIRYQIILFDNQLPDASGTNRNALEFIQYLFPVGCGPSSKTCPK